MKWINKNTNTLLEALSLQYPQSSKTTLRSWLKSGRIFVDGVKQKLGQFSLLPGQEIEISTKKKFIEEDFSIIYEDKDLVVIEKPVGLLSVSTNFEKGVTAHSFLKRYYRPKNVYVVHRLDQDTSGLMLFALSEEAYVKLKEMFEQHAIEREYVAIVEGKLNPLKGSWKSYLYEDALYKMHETSSSSKGQLAISHYEVVNQTKKFTRINIKLETGRKNQIRVHCQSSGHPIIGDNKYGGTINPIQRLGLHAYKLIFTHPITQKKLTFVSPVPDEFNQLVQP
ncbi:MAG: RNA pseudouridine synthase [Chlamydia sp. 32-24]|mgnify:FL=1|nr:MAG: RNA pseudouridine synthase [Chlamydia sp. 32-24]